MCTQQVLAQHGYLVFVEKHLVCHGTKTEGWCSVYMYGNLSQSPYPAVARCLYLQGSVSAWPDSIQSSHGVGTVRLPSLQVTRQVKSLQVVSRLFNGYIGFGFEIETTTCIFPPLPSELVGAAELAGLVLVLVLVLLFVLE